MMALIRRRVVLSRLAVVLAMLALCSGLHAQSRQVAFTFDDLPKQGPEIGVANTRAMTERLLDGLKRHGIRAVGFVNEGRLNGTEREPKIQILQLWLQAGHDLGNHTYSHTRFWSAGLERMKEDTLKGDPVTRELLSRAGREPRFFRHPTLNTGRTLEDKSAFEKFLADRGYLVAPVTIDNADWLFASEYEKALLRNDVPEAERIAAAYVPYMETMFEFYEKLSRDTLRREIPQILLLHANRINADKIDDLARMLKNRGYAFVTLADALRAPAYSLPDTYIGPVGISWLQRWNISRGAKFVPEPGVPEVMQKYDNTRLSGSGFKSGR